MDIDKQDKNYIIESTVKVSDEVLELLASSKTTESEQTENPNRMLAVKSIRASTHLSN